TGSLKLMEARLFLPPSGTYGGFCYGVSLVRSGPIRFPRFCSLRTRSGGDIMSAASVRTKHIPARIRRSDRDATLGDFGWSEWRVVIFGTCLSHLRRHQLATSRYSLEVAP